MAEEKIINIPGRLYNAAAGGGKIVANSEHIRVKNGTLAEWVNNVDEQLKNGSSGGNTTEIENRLNELKTTHDADIAEIRESLKNVEPNEKIKELETADLDDRILLENGIYNIKVAENAPANSKSGKLTVKRTESGSYQEWMSDGLFAFRNAILADSETSSFKVNDIETAPVNGVIRLKASETVGKKVNYRLSGYLNGHIEIYSETGASETTTITLENCYIKSDTEKAIYYNCDTKRLKIYLAANTHNYVLCESATTFTETTPNGAIGSFKNLEIGGFGYLAVKTNYGSHGIDAQDDMFITGKPHIYIDCCNGHDGIHTGKSFVMENGELEIHNANDGIGIGGSATGEVRVFAGKLSTFNLKQKSIDAARLQEKADDAGTSAFAYVYTDYTTTNFTVENCIKTKFINAESYNTTNLYSTGTITDSSGNLITSVEITKEDSTTRKVYTLSTKKEIYTISGYIDADIKITEQSIDLVLNNTCIHGDVIYTPSSKKLKIKSDDIENFLDKDSNGKVCKNVNIVTGSIFSSGNLSLTGKAYLLLNATSSGNKFNLIGSGSKYIKSATCGKFYIGADDDDYDAVPNGTSFEDKIGKDTTNGQFDLESKQLLYIDSLIATSTDKTITENGEKGASTIYDVQTGDFYINKLKTMLALKRDNGTGGRFIISEQVGDDGLEKINFVLPVLDSDFENVEFIKKAAVGTWTVLKENPEIDLSEYAKVNDIHVRTYTNRDAAEAAIDELALGDIVSYGNGADESADLKQSYDLLIVCYDSSNKKVFKEIKQGSGTIDTGTIKFNLESLTVNGQPVSGFDESRLFEANIGDTIVFKMSLLSSNYPNIRGTVRGLLNGKQSFETSIFPDEGNYAVWTYQTSNLNAGTYTFTLYGIESTGRQSERYKIKARIGGLNIKSTLNSETVLRVNESLTVPLIFEAADDSVENYLTVEVNDSKIINGNLIQTGNSNITIPGENIKPGENTIRIYVKNENNKTSNILEYNLIAAEEGQLYVLTDKDSYTCSSGGDLFVKIRLIQLGQRGAKFVSSLVIKNSASEIVHSEDSNLEFGSQTLRIVGLRYTKNDGSFINEENKTVHFSNYTAQLTVNSPDGITTQTKTFVIQCNENNYNIDTVAIDSDSLLCWFDAAGKSNSSINYDSWEDKSVKYRPSYADKTPVKATFHNFNWQNNGWLPDDKNNMALTINAGAYVSLDFMPFKNEPGNYKVSDIQTEKTTGMTISIDFQTQNILSEDAKVVSCLHEADGTEEVHYYLRDGFGEYIKNNDANIINYFTNAGGYCWVDGKYYNGDGITAYETTMIMPERVVNYNNTNTTKNSNFNTDTTDEATINYLKTNKFIPTDYRYDSSKEVDYKIFLGAVSSKVVQQTGFYVDAAYGVLTTGNDPSNKDSKFHVNFSENTRTRIDFVIQAENNTEPYYFRSMVCYVNGVLSNMQELSTNSKFSIADYKVYLGAKVKESVDHIETASDTGECKIYSFRVYNRALEPDEILRAYAAEIPDETEKKNFIDNNGVISGTLPQTLPEVCLYGYTDSLLYTTPSINKFIMQTATEDNISELKKVKEPAYITYVDPGDESKNWQGANEYLPIRLQFQGTSSMVYPCKNYKFKLYSPYDAAGNYINKDAGFIITDGKVSFNKNKKLKKDIGSGIAEFTFCLKADFMDSSHCNNTGVANFIADANQLSGKTPAQELNSQIRTTVYGYPVLLYYSTTPADADNRHFLGVYNLNLDKSDTDSFGLDKKVADSDGIEHDFGKAYFINDELSKKIGYYESTDTIELFDKDDQINKQYIAIKNVNGDIVAAKSEKGFIRSLNNDGVNAVECFEVKANSNANSPGGFGDFRIKQVDEGFEIRYPDEGDMEDEEYINYKTPSSQYCYSQSIKNGEAAVDFTTFSSPWYYHLQRLIAWISNSSKEDFLANLEHHFNKNFLMDYYLAVMMLGAVDSLGKNLMIGTWGPENHLYLSSEENAKTDNLAFEYTLPTSGNKIWVSPTKTKLADKTGIFSYKYAKNDDGRELFYDDNVRIKIKNAKLTFNENNHLTAEIANVSTTPGECIWYPTFYDIDTICGLDNAGVLCYDVDIEIGELTADGNAVYNTADSRLWSRVRDYLGEIDSKESSELSERWDSLKSKFNTATLIGGSCKPADSKEKGYFYDRQIATIPAKYYNEDCFIKYIYEGPFAPGTVLPNDSSKVAARGSGAYLYCVHGSRYEQMKRWFTQRIYFLDTLYRKTGADSASIRIENTYYDAGVDYDNPDFYAEPAQLPVKYPNKNDGITPYYSYVNGVLKYHSFDNGRESTRVVKPIKFKIDTYQPAYVGVRWVNGTKAWYKKARRNEIIEISGNTKTSTNQEVFIYGGENIRDLGDLSQYAISELNISTLTKLARLILGPTTASMKHSTLSLKFYYLSELNLQGYQNLTDLDLKDCPNLKIVKTDNSLIKNITLPANGALEYISYGSSVASINLENLLNLRTVATSGLGSLNTLNIINCPKIQGSSTNYNATAWEILQRTESAPISTINVKAYGDVSPTASNFFFPNKYYSKSSNFVNIAGEINYLGTVVPDNYIRFKDRFPNLLIKYPNISDASEMFANYKNLQCIGSIEAYSGQGTYGDRMYTTIYYWTDRKKDIFPNSQYNVSSTYNEKTTDIYKPENSEIEYRLIKLNNKDDLDKLRAEIKENLSGFTHFTNVSGMFKNMKILDYLDPDTFNNIDLSSADTSEMFAGCDNLKYFEMPNDIVKNKKSILYYIDDKEVSKEVYDETTEGTKTEKTIYTNPFMEEAQPSETSVYGKGIREIGVGMFRNCKNLKIFIRKLLTQNNVSKTDITETPDPIRINSNAFEYTCYNPDPEAQNQESGITLQRPVIFFEHDKKDICTRTNDAKTIIGGAVELDNPLVEDISEDDINKYYLLNQYGECIINTASDGKYKLINLANSDPTWLRECYFGITGVYFDKTNLLDSSDNNILSYAENKKSEKILLSLSTNQESFNVYNEYNLISETVGSIPVFSNNCRSIKKIGVTAPIYDCFDMSRPRFEIEYNVYPIFSNDGNNTIFAIDKINTYTDANDFNITDIYVYSKTKVILTNQFRNFKKLQSVYINDDIEIIEANAFSDCTLLRSALFFSVYKDTNDEFKHQITYASGDSRSNLKSIGDYAFSKCFSYTSTNQNNSSNFGMPNKIEHLGKYIFNDTKQLNIIYWMEYKDTPLFTIIPEGTFANSTKLEVLRTRSYNYPPVYLTEIGNYAFSNTSFNLFFASGEFIFYKNTSLVKIGDYAFQNNDSVKAVGFMDEDSEPPKFRILKNIKYIGESAFATSTVSTHYPVELVWDGTDYDNDFKDLVIGSQAFQNIKFIRKEDYDEQLIDWAESTEQNKPIAKIWMLPTIFVPKVASIGSRAFKPPLTSNPFKYCLMRDNESIGDSFVQDSKKIIYNYQGRITKENEADKSREVFIIVSKPHSGYDGEAYLYQTTIQQYTVASSVSDNGKTYAITQILEGAFAKTKNGYCSSLTFAYGSNIEKIETGVLTSSNFSAIAVRESDNPNISPTGNIIPDGLEIATGNILKETEWYKTLVVPAGTFITLGKYIIGYKPSDSEKSIGTYTLDLSNVSYTEYNIEKICNIIYDGAFSETGVHESIMTSVKFPNNCNTYEIYKDAFRGCSQLTKIDLPKNITNIGNYAFFGAPITYLFLPNTLKVIGNNAFTYTESGTTRKYGKLKFLNIEEGSIFNGTPLNLNEEIQLSNSRIPYANITFNTIHIPSTMNGVLAYESGTYSRAVSMRHVYVGELAINTDETDIEYYGTIYCKNYPLYKKYKLNEDGEKSEAFDIVYEEQHVDGYIYEVYTDNDGNPLYCPKFYRDICTYIGAYSAVDSNTLLTTNNHDICPIGYKSQKYGFTGNINLLNVKQYDAADITPLTEDQTPEMLKENMPRSLTRENILAILAGMAPNQITSEISLPKDAADLSSKDRDIFGTGLHINFVIRKAVE